MLIYFYRRYGLSCHGYCLICLCIVLLVSLHEAPLIALAVFKPLTSFSLSSSQVRDSAPGGCSESDPVLVSTEREEKKLGV